MLLDVPFSLPALIGLTFHLGELFANDRIYMLGPSLQCRTLFVSEAVALIDADNTCKASADVVEHLFDNGRLMPSLAMPDAIVCAGHE